MGRCSAHGLTYEAITDKISGIILNMGTPKWWFGALLMSSSLVVGLVFALTVLVFKGIGIWGNNQPVGVGMGRSRISSGGSVLVMPVRSSPLFFFS